MLVGEKLKYSWRDIPGFIPEHGRQDRPWQYVPIASSRLKYEKEWEKEAS